MQCASQAGRLLAGLVAVAIVAGGLLAACAIPIDDGPSASPPASGSPAPGDPSGESPSASAPTRPFRPTPAPAPTFATYTVRRGDTLIALARRFATTPESLAYWNRARYPSLDPDSPTYRPGWIEVGWQLVYIPGAVVDPEDLPPASTAPTGGQATAGPIGPYPTLPADGSAALVRRGPAGLDAVALTFEYPGGGAAGAAGPEAIVQWLEVNGMPATVFVGSRAAAANDPVAAAVLARLGAAQSVRPGLFAGVDKAAGLGVTLDAADEALMAGLGTTTVPWLRPAGGTASAAALQAAGAAGWTWAISWDVDPGDGVAPGAGGPIAADIATRVVSRAKGGSIVRLRLDGARTFEALPAIVDGLRSVGLRVVSLDELLGLTGEG